MSATTSVPFSVLTTMSFWNWFGVRFSTLLTLSPVEQRARGHKPLLGCRFQLAQIYLEKQEFKGAMLSQKSQKEGIRRRCIG